MDWIDELLDFYGFSKEEKYKNPHGECIAYKQELYADVYIFADGYEDYESIGD